MRFHADSESTWRNGRFWWYLRRDGYDKRAGVLSLEWTIPARHWIWEITVGDGDSGADLKVAVAIPLIVTLWVGLSRVFPSYWFDANDGQGEGREIGISIHGGSIWWSFWVGPMAEWRRDAPWCRWWRQGSFNVADWLLGETRYTEAEIAHERASVEMPEGRYPAFATVCQWTRQRPRWIARRGFTTRVTVERGIPHAGKGENSWDCGDDGLVSSSIEGQDIAAACQSFRAAVLKRRRNYGEPSAASIREALS